MKILSLEQIRASERAAVGNGLSEKEMMGRAGEKIADVIAKEFPPAGKRVLVVCGNGNNGGDGFVIAAALSRMGASIELSLPLGAPRSETAEYYYRQSDGLPKVAVLREDYDLVVDALFGIGLTCGIEGELAGFVEQLNRLPAKRIAVDLPSGVLCDGGVPGTAFRADLTVTVIALKPACYLPPASEFCGRVEAVDIGVAPVAYSYLTLSEPSLPRRPKNAHKGSCGTALLLCGSYGMCGAEILAARAALRSGAGLVRAMVCDKNYTAFCTAVPEAVTLPVPTSPDGAPVLREDELYDALRGADALLIGCGLGQTETARRLVRTALTETTVPTVLDADGINLMTSDIDILKKIKAPLILTPHPGEMARLCHTEISVVESDRVGHARYLSDKLGCIVVLKGANTVIASPDGRVFFNTTGNPGMATGGSGDVLAGMTVSLLAQGIFPLQAASAAVWLHGRAGDLAAAERSQRALLPSDLIEVLGQTGL